MSKTPERFRQRERADRWDLVWRAGWAFLGTVVVGLLIANLWQVNDTQQTIIHNQHTGHQQLALANQQLASTKHQLEVTSAQLKATKDETAKIAAATGVLDQVLSIANASSQTISRDLAALCASVATVSPGSQCSLPAPVQPKPVVLPDTTPAPTASPAARSTTTTLGTPRTTTTTRAPTTTTTTHHHHHPKGHP